MKVYKSLRRVEGWYHCYGVTYGCMFALEYTIILFIDIMLNFRKQT